MNTDPILARRGFAIADRASRELILSEALVGSDGLTCTLLSDLGDPAERLGQLDPQIAEAVEWLQDRKQADLHKASDGLVVILSPEVNDAPRDKILVVRAHPTFEDADSPAFAIFRLDQALIDKVHQSRRTLETDEALRIVKEHTIRWENADRYSLQGDGVVVDSHWFWFTAYPEFGGGYDVETDKVFIGDIAKFLADERPVLYLANNQVLDDNYDDPCGLIEAAAPLLAKFTQEVSA